MLTKKNMKLTIKDKGKVIKMGKYVEYDFCEAFKKYEEGITIKSLASGISHLKYEDWDYVLIKKSVSLNGNFSLKEIRGKWLVYEE